MVALAVGGSGPVGTMVLMTRFYERSCGEKGLAPPDALRHAQQWVRDATRAELQENFPGVEASSASTGARRVGCGRAPYCSECHTSGRASPTWAPERTNEAERRAIAVTQLCPGGGWQKLARSDHFRSAHSSARLE